MSGIHASHSFTTVLIRSHGEISEKIRTVLGRVGRPFGRPHPDCGDRIRSNAQYLYKVSGLTERIPESTQRGAL